MNSRPDHKLKTWSNLLFMLLRDWKRQDCGKLKSLPCPQSPLPSQTSSSSCLVAHKVSPERHGGWLELALQAFQVFHCV